MLELTEEEIAFINGKITKRSDLENNDSLSSLEGNACQQTHHAFFVFYEFLKTTMPSNILEIGTALGGFTMILQTFLTHMKIPCSITTYDITEYAHYQNLRNNGIDVNVRSIFNDDGSLDSKAVNIVTKPGTTIVLCDGGDKQKEFASFAPLLKSGDYILAHDYARDSNVFNEHINRKIWNWCEITNNDINVYCEKYNLVPYKEKHFNTAAWTCRKKSS